MKLYFLNLFLVFTLSLYAQDHTLSQKVIALENQINQTKSQQKLILLDSLTDLVLNNPNHKYDSIAKRTIHFAKSLDSIVLAGNHTANLIYYYNNVIGQPELGKPLFKEFLEAYPNLSNNEVLGQLYINVADSYYYTGAIEESITYYKTAGTYAENAENDRLIGLSKLYQGFSKSDLGRFSEASTDIKKAAEYFRKVKDTFNLIGAKIGIAIQYSQVNFIEEANAERLEAIELAKQSNNYGSLVSLYYNSATDYKVLNKPQERVNSIKAAIAISDKANIRVETEHLLYTNLVVASIQNDDLNEAKLYFEKVLSYGDLNTVGKSKESFIEAKKWLLYNQGNYKEAITQGEVYLSLKKKRGQYGEILEAHRFLNLAYLALADRTNAYKHLEQYSKIKDSATSAKNIKSLAFYQTLYDTEKKDLKIQAQETDIALLNEKSKVKNRNMTLVISGLIVLFGFIIVLRSRNKQKQRQLLQEQFSRDLMHSQEDERTRIAKELHDSVGQQLTLIKKKSQNANQDDISLLTHNTLEEVRSISRGLYPAMLKQLGLKESIEQLIYDYDEETNLFFTSEIDDIDPLLNEVESLNFYRFIQECMTNIIKHAEAKTVALTIKKSNKNITTILEDNGKGFNVNAKQNKKSLGLKTITERISIFNGKLNIESNVGKGTKISAIIPVTI